MSRTQRFLAEPLGSKGIAEIPGVGPNTESILRKSGIQSATQLYERYLKLIQSPDKFKNLLENYGILTTSAQDILDSMDRYFNKYGQIIRSEESNPVRNVSEPLRYVEKPIKNDNDTQYANNLDLVQSKIDNNGLKPPTEKSKCQEYVELKVEVKYLHLLVEQMKVSLETLQENNHLLRDKIKSLENIVSCFNNLKSTTCLPQN